MRDENLFVLKDLGDPVKLTSDYPVSKCRTKENVDKLRAAEANLDLFWGRIDGLVNAKTNNLRGTRLGQLLSQPRALQRTPEWVEPEPGANKNKSRDAQPGGSAAEVLYRTFISLSLGTLAPKETPTVAQKAKVKTRGAREAVTLPEEPQVPSPSMKEDVQPISRSMPGLLRSSGSSSSPQARVRQLARSPGTTSCMPWRQPGSWGRSCMGRVGTFSRRGWTWRAASSFTSRTPRARSRSVPRGIMGEGLTGRMGGTVACLCLFRGRSI